MILGIEIDHSRAPLALREHTSFHGAEIAGALERLLKGGGLESEGVLSPPCDAQSCAVCSHARYREAAILSTCNRTGIYALGSCPEPLARFLATERNVEPKELGRHISVYQNREAVEHLFGVAAGLKSQVLGEPQILGQVRDAHEQALGAGVSGPVIDEFFRRAIKVGKRVRTETELGRHPSSLASVAAELAARVHRDLGRASALLLGTGEMGTLVARFLHKRGARRIAIASRSLPRAEALAGPLSGHAFALSRADDELPRTDIVVSATEESGYVLTASQVASKLGSRDGRPLLMIDLGLPRNLDPKIRELEGVILRDLDDLKAVSEEGLQRREQEIPKARQIVQEETESFMSWLLQRRATPVIKALREHAEEVRREQLHWALPKLEGLDERQERVVEGLTRRLVNKLLHAPTQEIKSLAQEADTCEPFLLARRLFGLERGSYPDHNSGAAFSMDTDALEFAGGEDRHDTGNAGDEPGREGRGG